MRHAWRNFRGAVHRVLPDCQTHAQAVAFGMFLAFFPILLLVFGVLSSSERLSAAVEEMLVRLRWILPPGSKRLVVDYLVQQGRDPWKWILLGLAGTLLAGTQVMTSLLQGFRIVHRSLERPRFWSVQGRALLLLSVTIVPWIAAVILTVFGRQVRGWMIERFGLPTVFHAVWLVVYLGLALVMVTLILAVVYRVGQPGCRGWNEVLPGAVVATLLWWTVNSAFGFYVRHMPYDVVYGHLAAAIGLIVWMYVSGLVVFLGTAYNAEARAVRRQPVLPEERTTDEVERVTSAKQM